VTCRFKAGNIQKEYTLPPGSRFEFQRDSNGQPDLFLSPEGPATATGAVSILNIPPGANSVAFGPLVAALSAHSPFFVHIPVPVLPL
jgi:hypothetical protein